MGRWKRAGRLTGDAFQYLPLEVQYQVFGYADPNDLLSLARTDKRLRDIIFYRSTGLKIWESSFQPLYNTGLPECNRTIMTEPQYADLLFKNGCQDCLGSRSQKTDWHKALRICKPCYKTRRTLQPNFGSSYPAGLPEDEHHAWDGTSYRIRDWIERVRTERKTSKKNVLEERMDAIQERLDELGYEVSDYAAVMKEQWIKDPRPLSDRGTHFPRPPIIFNNRQTVWNNIKDKLLGKCDEKRNIREELIAAAEAAEAEKVRIADLKKILRRDREPTLQKKYRARVKVNDYHDTFVPDFSVVLETEACKELLESLDEEGYTRRTNDWLQTVSATVRDYHDRMYGHLMDCAGHALRLQLTSTKVAFTCRTCNHLGLIWPAMATHHCFVTNTEVFSRQLDQSARFYFRNRVFDLCEDRTKILGSLSAWLGYGQDAGGVDHKALIRMGDIWTLNADGPSDYREWSESWDLSEFARGVNRNQSDRVVSTLTHIAESSAGIHPLRMSWTFLVEASFVLKGRLTPWVVETP